MIEYMDIGSIKPNSFARRFRRAGRPVIITNGFSDTPTWTLQYLTGRLSAEKYATRYYRSNRFDEPIHAWSHYCGYRDLTFAEYASLLQDRTAHAERLYFAQIGIGATPAGGSIAPNLDRVAARTGLRRRDGSDVNIWLGPGDHTEPLHFDTDDGTMIVLKGSKKVSLFPPWATPGLYPFPLLTAPIWPWFSQVDIDSPDHSRFPRLAAVLPERIDVVLREGELLFIPAHWWHQVAADSADYVCSINQFWSVKPPWRKYAHGRAPLIARTDQVCMKVAYRIETRMRRIRDRGTDPQLS